MDEETADELTGCQGHDLVSRAAVGAIVLVLEGDAVLVERNQPAVGDGDADCAGFRMPAMIDGATYTVAGVRKPARNEPAGDDRRRRRGLGYGDLADAEGECEGARCAGARAMPRQAGNSSWD